jgi:hypothetical protein
MKKKIGFVQGLLEKDGFYLQNEREYMTSLLELMKEIYSAFLLRKKIFGEEEVPLLPPRHNVSMDLQRIIEDYRGFSLPQLHQFAMITARFTPAPHFFFSNQNWGAGGDSVATVLDFLRQVPDTLVESVKIFFPGAGERVDFDPLISVLKDWKNLYELTFLCMQDTMIPEEAQELVFAIQPRILKLRGCLGFQALRRMNEFENLEELSMVLVSDGGRIPESVEYLWKRLPQTVSKVSLQMGSFPGDSICEDLHACLDALPAHVTKLGLNGFNIWLNEGTLQRVFGENRFEELSILNSETTTLRKRDGKWSHLLDRQLAHCFALKKLGTDKISESIARIIRACDLDKLVYTVPFSTNNNFDADKGRAFGAILDSQISEIDYRGPVSTTKDTLDLQNLIEKRKPSAFQRALALMFIQEVLKKTCAESPVTHLGAIPVHVLHLCIRHCATLTVDEKEKRERLEEDSKEDFFRTLEVAEELDWFQGQPKHKDEYGSLVKFLQHRTDSWYTAVTTLTDFLFSKADKKKRSIVREMLEDQRAARKQKRALENPSENDRGGKRERK